MKFINIKLNIFLFFLLIIIGCKTKQVTLTEDVIKIDEVKPKVEIEEVVIIEDTLKIDLDSIFQEIKLKEIYKIAFILPFDEDSIFKKYQLKEEADLSDFNFTSEAENSLSFIQGVMTALEQNKLPTKMELFVFDSKKSPRGLAEILDKVSQIKPDWIVGGMNRNDAKTIAEFAKEKQIYHFSPFLPSGSIAENNPYYLMVEPGIDKHFDEMISYALDSFPEASFKVFHEDNKHGFEYAKKIEDNFKVFNDTTQTHNLKYALIEIATDANDRKKFNAIDYLDKEGLNLVILPSFNEGFVQSIMFQLNSASRDHQVKLFGMPTWIDSETLRLRHFNTLNLHLTQSSFMDNDSVPLTLLFHDNFVEKFKKEPSSYAYLGGDLMDFFNHLIFYGFHNQLNFKEALFETTFKGMSKNFDFIPIFNETNNIERIENKSVFVVRYENFEIIICR
jgi:hypothetical protein